VLQIRFHGRGGQGVVSAAEMLSVAAFLEGKYAQAFPSFGSERMGAPVASYCRIADQPIRSREPVVHPDVIVIQDATLLHDRNSFEGLQRDGHILLNSSRQFEELAERPACNVPATEIALRHLGRPLPNSALLGGLAALTGVVGLDSVKAAIKSKFAGDIGERNAAAAAEAFQLVSQKASRIAGDVRC
jgi:pyruvate ferredoxin oxidoreductase gamma subunit